MPKFLFCGYIHYAAGGAEDFATAVNDSEEALAWLNENFTPRSSVWAHLCDDNFLITHKFSLSTPSIGVSSEWSIGDIDDQLLHAKGLPWRDED